VVLLEDVDHVDVDEVDAELLASNTVFLHRLQQSLGELVHLLRRSGAGGAFDPRKRMPYVFFRQPWRGPLDLEAQVALFEQNRTPVGAAHGLAQTPLEPIPPRRRPTRDRPD